MIDNRPGASGNIGTNQVAKRKPNGYTLLFTSSGHAINPSLFKYLPFEPTKDFEAITELASGPSVSLRRAHIDTAASAADGYGPNPTEERGLIAHLRSDHVRTQCIACG